MRLQFYRSNNRLARYGLAFLIIAIMPSLEATKWFEVVHLDEAEEMDTCLMQPKKSIPSSGVVAYTQGTTALFQHNTHVENPTSTWSDPIQITSDGSNVRVVQAGEHNQVLFTWCNSSRILQGRTYNLNTRSFNEPITLLNYPVETYDIASSGRYFSILAKAQDHTIQAVSGTHQCTERDGCYPLASTPVTIAESGTNPKIDINAGGQAVGTFLGDRDIYTSRLRADSSWTTVPIARSDASSPSPQVAVMREGSYVIAFKHRLPATEILEATGIATYTFAEQESQDPVIKIASRTDESVASFNLTKGDNSVALSYKALTQNLPRYQLTMNLPNKNGKIGNFSEPQLMSQGEGDIGAFTCTVSKGRQTILGYGDDENIALNTAGYRPGKGDRSGRNSQAVNFNPDSISTVGTISMGATHTAVLSAWVHDGKLYAQTGTMPPGN